MHQLLFIDVISGGALWSRSSTTPVRNPCLLWLRAMEGGTVAERNLRTMARMTQTGAVFTPGARGVFM